MAFMGETARSAHARRVLVTGASGFLGRYVLADLAAHGHEVFAAGRNREVLAARVEPANVVHGSLEDLASTKLPVDAVIHCAALSTPWGRWEEFHRANVLGTQHAFAFARANHASRFVHISSPSIYAASADRLNIREHQVDETNRLNGYIRSKIAAERILRELAAQAEAPEVVILRPRGLIGDGDPSLIPRLMSVHDRLGIPVFRGGSNVIDVTAVENVALAARLALTNGDPRAGTYNITNGDPRPFAELLSSLLTKAGITPRFRRLPLGVVKALAAGLEGAFAVLPGRPEPPLTRYTLSTIAYSQTLDITKARTELGYEPAVRLDDALDRVADGLRRAR